MDFLTLIAGGLLSSTTVLAAGVYFFQTSFTRLLDKRMGVFKQQLFELHKQFGILAKPEA
jgi:hypothetical protein